MKVINKIIAILSIFVLLIACQEEDQVFLSEETNFVRFNMLVDANGEPLPFGEYETTPEVSELMLSKFQEVKIPVALASTTIQDLVVDYELGGNYENFTITPEQLTFSQSQLVDTLYVNFTERWLPSNAQDSIVINLSNVSDENVSIGYDREVDPMNSFSIVLEELTPIKYGFAEETNRIVLDGNNNEVITFDVVFDQEILTSDIEGQTLFTEEVNDERFTYTITQQPFNNLDTRITYEVKLTNDLTEYVDEEFILSLSLNDIPNFETQGNVLLEIVKEQIYDRNPDAFPSQHWFDPTNEFYLNRGYFWWYDTNDERCEWRRWSAFSVPIDANEGDLNAKEYNNSGVYYDAFQIGFQSPIEGRTTNPFALKSWFSNEATDSDNSPGFNINPVFEFIPDVESVDGNGETISSETGGQVLIINQSITISNRNEKAFVIGISGEGTYQLRDDGNWEMSFELTVENDELFEGGSQTAYYYLYNFNNRTVPDDISSECISEIDLNEF